MADSDNHISIGSIKKHIQKLRQGWPSVDECDFFEPQEKLDELWLMMDEAGLSPPPCPPPSELDPVKRFARRIKEESYREQEWREFRNALRDAIVTCNENRPGSVQGTGLNDGTNTNSVAPDCQSGGDTGDTSKKKLPKWPSDSVNQKLIEQLQKGILDNMKQADFLRDFSEKNDITFSAAKKILQRYRDCWDPK